MATASRTLLRTASARSRMNYRRSDAAVWNGAVGGGGPERATLVSGEANSGCAFPSLLGWQRRCVSSTPRGEYCVTKQLLALRRTELKDLPREHAAAQNHRVKLLVSLSSCHRST